MDLLAPARLATLVAALRAGTLLLPEYLDRVWLRVRQVDPLVRALLPEPDRLGRLRREAQAWEAHAPAPASRPILYGAVVGVKDQFRVDGFLTQAGSTLPPELFDGPEGSVVAALRAAGALVLGKTAMDELAYVEPAPTRNPHNLAHTPGGSSSGSAAAVAAGLCPLALGSQTSRSMIGPAAYCGVVGFKPGFGRIPSDGMIPLAPSLDTVGMFTQDVASMVLASTALVADWRAPGPLRRPVLGVPGGKFLSWTFPDGRQAFETHVRQVADAGFTVRRVPFFGDDDLEEMDRLAMMLLHGEMARVHARWFERYPERYRERTARGISRGQAVTDHELAACRTHQHVFRNRLRTLMDEAGIDLWITPSSAGAAPVGLDTTGWGGMTTVWSYAGLPCISVPAGRAAHGLPLGLQCIAASGQDECLLTWAGQIEAVLGFAGEPEHPIGEDLDGVRV
jgi:Asp-tRNA(Asn)/Glu-tRNA(Gln) amidotransferase A subunit family amidase